MAVLIVQVVPFFYDFEKGMIYEVPLPKEDVVWRVTSAIFEDLAEHIEKNGGAILEQYLNAPPMKTGFDWFTEPKDLSR